MIDSENHRYNFDHHSGCLRFATLATCQQVLTAINLGLEDLEKYTVYANDADLDVCLSYYLLKNADRCKEPQVKKLVDAVGICDAYLGAYPVNGMLKAVEFVSFPETESKKKDDYSKISNEGLATILEAVMHRVDLYLNNEAELGKCQKHTEYKLLRNEGSWVAVESQDPHVYSGLYQNGFDRICLVRPQIDGSNAIMLAKRSDFIDNFPLDKICEELNKIEPGWGGGSTVIGSPRNADGSRSHLSLDTVVEVINKVLQRA
jgi:hypothetical protein